MRQVTGLATFCLLRFGSGAGCRQALQVVAWELIRIECRFVYSCNTSHVQHWKRVVSCSCLFRMLGSGTKGRCVHVVGGERLKIDSHPLLGLCGGGSEVIRGRLMRVAWRDVQWTRACSVCCPKAVGWNSTVWHPCCAKLQGAHNRKTED